MSILGYYTRNRTIHSIVGNYILTILPINSNAQWPHTRILFNRSINF